MHFAIQPTKVAVLTKATVLIALLRSALCSNGGSMTSKSAKVKSAAMRQIPSVDALLARPAIAALAAKSGRGLVLAMIRKVLAELRTELAEKSGERDSAERC